MPNTKISRAATPDRIVQAALGIWAASGTAGISVRALAQHAETAPASVYHHFGDLERLYDVALEFVARGVHSWCTDRAAQIDDVDLHGPGFLRRLLATTIDDWTRECRALAIAWRECLMLSARNPRFAPALNKINMIWTDFWVEACIRAGLPEAGEGTGAFFAGEVGLHLMRWKRLIDRSALDETCDGWVAWLSGATAPEDPWRGLARDIAARVAPGRACIGGTAEAVAEAAADLVEDEGVAALTHRAVAARAGLTLGVVSYNVRTSADLARAAFDAIYRRITPVRPISTGVVGPDRQNALELLQSGAEDLSPHMLALDELMNAAARDPSLSEFIPHLRYERGRTAGYLLTTIVDGLSISPLDASIFSSFVTGQRQVRIGLRAEERRPYTSRTLGRLPFLVPVLGSE